MKYFFIVLVIAFSVASTTNLSTYKTCSCNSDPSARRTISASKKTDGMGFVIDDKLPVMNPYGSYGALYVFDFIFPDLPLNDNPIKHMCYSYIEIKIMLENMKNPY